LIARYEDFLAQARAILQPLLDDAPPAVAVAPPRWGGGGHGGHGTSTWGAPGARDTLSSLHTLSRVSAAAWRHRDCLRPLYELLTGPAAPLLDRWFESDVLKATLATGEGAHRESIRHLLYSPVSPHHPHH